MRILLTGATGFLGKRIVTRLQDAGHELWALARSERSAAALLQVDVNPVPAGLTDPNLADRIAAIEPPEAVIHLAAEIATQRNAQKLWQANHEGTTNLYQAVRGLKLKRFIFASTVVVGEAHGELLTEESTLNVETEYGRTKQASEKMLLEAFQEDKFPAIIVRPSHIYGSGGWFEGLIQDLKKGLFRIPGNGKNMWDVVHVDDVAAAFVHLLARGKPGEIYHCVDDTPVTMKDFFTEAAGHIGKKGVGHAPVFLANLLKGKDPIRAATRSARSSNTKLRGTGWKPVYPDYHAGLDQVFGPAV